MEVSHMAVAIPYEKAMEKMENSGGKNVNVTMSIRVTKDLKNVLAKLNSMRLAELHLIIEETQNDDSNEVAQLFEHLKLLRLNLQPLARFSVSYHACNNDDYNNSVRFMILFGILQQLNWDSCHNVDVNLNVNYLNDDPRLDLFAELPLNLTISGNTGSTPDAIADAQKLKTIEKSYIYLDGYI